MTTTSALPVLAGVDGSVAALQAVEIAAAEAALSHRGLCVLHVGHDAAASGVAETLVAQAADHARAAVPGVSVSSRVLTGDPVLQLRAATAKAHLLVLGEPTRRGRLAATLPARVVAGAACPVLVVRGRPLPDGPVVAGVDGRPAGQAALRLAAAQADRRGVGLIALHAWRERESTVLGDSSPMSYENWSGQLEHQRVLAEAVAGLATAWPGVHLERQVVHGSARRLLTDCSRGAQLMVVGRRSRQGLGTVMLASVSRHLIEHSACPVLVSPADTDAIGADRMCAADGGVPLIVELPSGPMDPAAGRTAAGIVEE
jgi:nucleotide-binding universal stress UspA family protein